VPGGVGHRRVAPRDSTVPREQPSPSKGCGTPVATAPPRTMSCLQPCVATNWEILLRPDVCEGRNTMLRRGRCASSVSESVHGRLGFSRVIEEPSEGQYHWGEERRVSCGPVTPCHGRKRAGLSAHGNALVRGGEWPILAPFTFPKSVRTLTFAQCMD